jgi:hypothetical protein
MWINLSDEDLALIEAHDDLQSLHARCVAMIVTIADSASYIEQAREDYAVDEIEIDDEPAVSAGDDGRWVQAWLWVTNEEVEDRT